MFNINFMFIFEILKKLKFKITRQIPSSISSIKSFKHSYLPIHKRYEIVIFLKSSESHALILESWYEFFINKTKKNVLLSYSPYYRNYGQNLNIIFGSCKPNLYSISHQLKKKIIESNLNYVINESSLLGRGKVYEDDSKVLWQRIGLNGFLANENAFLPLEFCNPKRLDEVLSQKNLIIKPWKPGGEHILIALQIPGDAALLGQDILYWAINIIKKIRRISDKKIVLRKPQLKRIYKKEFLDKILTFGNIEIQNGTFDNLKPTLINSFFTCTYTSGLGIDSVINGIPVVVDHPGSFVYELRTDLVEALNGNYHLPDRTNVFIKLASAEHSLKEVKEGKTFENIQKIINLKKKDKL